MTIETMILLIGTDSYTTFGDEIVKKNGKYIRNKITNNKKVYPATEKMKKY